MASSEEYSVRCERCETSFAPETKTCIHCGGPLGEGLIAALRSATSDGGPAEVEEPAGRSWGWTVFVILAVGFQLLRQCA